MSLEKGAAFWKADKKDRDGKTYYTGKAEADIPAGAKLMLFQNDKGDNERRPDLRVLIQVDDEADQREPLPQGANKRKHEPIDVDDSLPF